MHAPTSAHWTVAKRVLRYLKNSVDHGLIYTKGSLNLFAYCDSDWACSPDDRQSTSGFAIFLGNCLVSWSVKKQAVVSRSSTEAEYQSLAITTAELLRYVTQVLLLMLLYKAKPTEKPLLKPKMLSKLPIKSKMLSKIQPY
jgi:hypothetical protein